MYTLKCCWWHYYVPNILSFHWFLLVFILKRMSKNWRAISPWISIQSTSNLGTMILRYWFSESLCGSMLNFDGLLLIEFLSNRLQTFKAQGSLGIEVLCYYFFTVLLPAALTMRPRPSPLSDSVCSELNCICRIDTINQGRIAKQWITMMFYSQDWE